MKWLRKLLALEPRQKKFALTKAEIQRLVYGFGGCIASDMITVQGLPVRFMYREKPHNEMDSGWRFFAGLEDDEYMADSKKHEVYDLNTIANYDHGIIPLIESPVGSVFARGAAGEAFVPVRDWKVPE